MRGLFANVRAYAIHTNTCSIEIVGCRFRLNGLFANVRAYAIRTNTCSVEIVG